jgi:protein TonB
MFKTRKLFQIGSNLWTHIICLLILVSAISASAQTTSPRRLIFTVVEQPPTFPGGSGALEKYLSDHLRFPDGADDKFRNMTLFANFIVTETGAIDSVHILKPVNDAVDAEVVRVLENMPAWIPGKQNGHAVAVRYNVPARFPKK